MKTLCYNETDIPGLKNGDYLKRIAILMQKFRNTRSSLHNLFIKAKDVDNTMFFKVLALLALTAIVIILICTERKGFYKHDYDCTPRVFEPEEKRRVGRHGELIATNIIKKVLREDDFLFTNVPVSYDGKRTELDNVIVNKYGVFIIEVKYYKGRLCGTEDDYEWKKYKDDGYGNTFEKNVKNPIRQVKRQTYVLAKHLDYYGSGVWVKGYAFLVNGNSPVISSYMLESLDDIDKAIHTFERNRLNTKNIESIKRLLSNNCMFSD